MCRNAVGMIITTRDEDGKRSLCSSALIGPDAVVTAGHCVHSKGSWALNVTFSPGADGPARPYGTIPWASVTTYPGWTRNGDIRFDMAVIRLERPSPSGSWLGLVASSTYVAQNLTTAGGWAESSVCEMPPCTSCKQNACRHVSG